MSKAEKRASVVLAQTGYTKRYSFVPDNVISGESKYEPMQAVKRQSEFKAKNESSASIIKMHEMHEDADDDFGLFETANDDEEDYIPEESEDVMANMGANMQLYAHENIYGPVMYTMQYTQNGVLQTFQYIVPEGY